MDIALPFVPCRMATCRQNGDIAFLEKPYGGQMRRVCIVTSSGMLLVTFDIWEKRTRRDLCFSPNGTHIIIVDSYLNQLLYYTREGNCEFSHQLPDYLQASVRYISVDSSGRLILTCFSNERRRKGCIFVLKSQSTLPEIVFGKTNLVHPEERAVYHKNKFYVFDDKKIKIFDGNGNFTTVVEPRQVNPNDFNSLTINPVNEIITACNQRENTIQIFTTDYKLITSLSIGPEIPKMSESFADIYRMSGFAVVIYNEVERCNIFEW